MKIRPETVLRIVTFLFFLLIWNFTGLSLALSVMIAAIPYGFCFLVLFAAGLTGQPIKFGQVQDDGPVLVANMVYKPELSDSTH